MLYVKHLSGQGKIKLTQGILKTYTSGNPELESIIVTVITNRFRSIVSMGKQHCVRTAWSTVGCDHA